VRSDIRRLFPIGVCLLLAWPAGAQTSASESPAASSSAAAISLSRRFVATGMTTVENMELAAAADQVARKLEQSVGKNLPFSRESIVGISIRRDEKQAHGRVVKAQGWVDRRLEQKLIITNLEQVDQEDVLEGLCWLLLNRYVMILQSSDARRAKPGAVPDWISVGMAQNLFLSLRARNSEAVVKLWEQQQGLSFAEVVDLEYLPEGRWSEKAFSALAVDWLASQATTPSFWDQVFQRRADRLALSPEWAASNVLRAVSVRDVEKGWDLWLAHQTEIKREWGTVTDVQIEALRSLFVVRPNQLGVAPGADAPAWMTMGDLLLHRGKPWFDPMVARLELKVRSQGLAQAGEYKTVVDLYAEYLSELTRYPSKSFWYRVFHRRPGDRQLQSQLAEADKALLRLEASVRERDLYMDGAEKTFAAHVEPLVAAQIGMDMEKAITRSSLQKYVDEVEQQMK